VNYGVVPDMQLHAIAPLSYASPEGEVAHHGYGDTELGVKVRFVREGKWRPQIGTFPLFEVPTGSSARSLGNGSAQMFVPLLFQKSFGPWTTYGGPGAWFDLGASHDRWWFLGFLVQRRLAPPLSMGVEVFHLSPKGRGGEPDTRFDVGAVVDFAEWHHLLLSAGRSISGPSRFQCYVAWLVTLGPTE
jgi:hypothetical protein